jgi:fucose 4-O-acetylase-like acetyltransferase
MANPPPLDPAASAPRLAWVDQLRTLVIVLVVNMHACVTYSHVGSWYVMEMPEPPLATRIAFVFWQAHLQSFFMGILFLLAGYFAHGSIERRGPAGFVRERFVRLGLPTLLYMVAIHPLIVFGLNPNGNDYGSRVASYLGFLAHGTFLEASGPMWFAAALLAFSAILAGWRAWRPRPPDSPPAPPAVPGPRAFVPWILVLVAATFLVRTAQPIGTSVVNMQLCYFSQYILAFAAGVAAARGGWLATLARSPLARRAGWTGLILGPLGLAALLVLGGAARGRGFEAYVGGWHWAAFGYASWEQLTGLALGLGFLAFCAAELDQPTRLSRWLADRSFAVYLFHPAVLVALTLALRPLELDPFIKVSLLTATGLAGSLIVADLARRLPGLRAIL